MTLLLSCVAAAAAMSLPDEGEKKKKKKFCSLCFSIFYSVLLCLALLLCPFLFLYLCIVL